MFNNPQRIAVVKDYNAIIQRLSGTYGKAPVVFMHQVTDYSHWLMTLKVPHAVCIMPPMMANYVAAEAIKWSGGNEWVLAEHEAKEMEQDVFEAMLSSEQEFDTTVTYALQVCKRTDRALCAEMLSTAHAKLMLRTVELKFLEGG